MSNRAIDAVKDFSKSKGSERLLLVMIADGIGKDTGVYEARISTLMADCNMSERWVQRLIVRLVELGELIVIERTGHSSAFMIPIFAGEQGYDPQPCTSEQHTCLKMHTPLSVDRENVRREEWAAQRRKQRASRKVKTDKAAPKGVNDSAPPANSAEIAAGGERECTPPRPIVHPRVNDSAPPGERECTHNPRSNPLVLPEDEPDGTSPLEQNFAELTPGDMPPGRLWARIVAKLKESTPEAQMANHIAPARITHYGWDRDAVLCVELAAVGHAHADIIDRRYSYLIADALARVYRIPASRVALSIVCAAQVARG